MTQQIRCAIYARKSSEEGLEQSFNSLQAQREACEAYIKSQKHEGWHGLSTRYDDGGFSGGSMERPALQQLLADIASGKINLVVVYKVDRLTRSLFDFSKIIESFDAQNVSFVSVTQQFNTTTSMGRLTLNVLLSFAQFEREVTGERIRDKIAASKKKGMWMGGTVPLGYDIKDRQLVVNKREATTVRLIFSEYIRMGCVSRLQKELARTGIVSKKRASAEGRISGGVPFARGALYQLLANRTYIGRIPHKTESYPGQHEAIVSAELWEEAKTLLEQNNRGQRGRGRRANSSLLTGILFDEHGNRYTPTHAVKGGRRYRYYTSQAVIRKAPSPSPHGRLPAAELEGLVEERFQKFLTSPTELSDVFIKSGSARETQSWLKLASSYAEQWRNLAAPARSDALSSCLQRIVVRSETLQIEVDASGLKRRIQGGASTSSNVPSDNPAPSKVVLVAPLSNFGHRPGTSLVLTGRGTDHAPSEHANDPLLKAIARAHDWKERIIAGEFCSKEDVGNRLGFNASYVGKILRLADLAPSVTDKLVCGSAKVTGRFEIFARKFPSDWKLQIWDKPDFP